MLVPKLPQQVNDFTPENGEDCGVYLLEYADAFCRNISFVSHDMKKKGLANQLNESIFTHEKIVARRKSMLGCFNAVSPLAQFGIDYPPKRRKLGTQL